MNFTELFLLYSNHQPLYWEYKDTSHGEDDLRCTVFAQLDERKLAGTRRKSFVLTIEKYGGQCSIHAEDETFTLKILIPVP